MSASTEFATNLPFLGYKQRNAALDNFFYDTGRLTLEERAKLTPLADREGSIIVGAAEQRGPQDPPLHACAPLHDQGGGEHSRHRCCGRRQLFVARHSHYSPASLPMRSTPTSPASSPATGYPK